MITTTSGGRSGPAWNVINPLTGFLDGLHTSKAAADESLVKMQALYPSLKWEIIQVHAWEYPDDHHYHANPANADYLRRLNDKAGRKCQEG